MKQFICIECPRGCNLSIDENLNVSGNLCVRGKNYAINEVTCPKRILTSTVKLINAPINRLPVITSLEIPKDKMFEVMKKINEIEVFAPIKLHDVIIKNVCDLNVDIIATRTIEKK